RSESLSSPSVAHPTLSSFPTRRSSDLGEVFLLANPEKSAQAFAIVIAALLHLSSWAADKIEEQPQEEDLLAVAEPFIIARNPAADRKSTRLNSSHVKISYAVFCLKTKK